MQKVKLLNFYTVWKDAEKNHKRRKKTPPSVKLVLVKQRIQEIELTALSLIPQKLEFVI